MSVSVLHTAIVQGATAATTLTVTFTAATAGNLLVLYLGLDKSSGGCNAVTGWTKFVDSAGASVSIGVYYKVATGGETTVSPTWVTASASGSSGIVVEYTGNDTTTPVGSAATPTYSDVTVTTMALDPPAANATAGGMAVAMFAIDTNNAAANGWTMTATGWSQDASVGASGTGMSGTWAGHFTSALTASQDITSTTFTSNSTTDQIHGTTFVINAAGGGSTPITLADTGAGAEVLATTAAVPLADTGSGVDALSFVPATLQTPTGLTATAVSSTQVNLAWDVDPLATGYDVERNSVVIVTNQPGTTFNDTGLTPSTTYSYRVRARA